MVKAFTPRKKKPVKVLDKQTKTVRIDANTLIEVSVSIPDDVARERYYERHKIVVKPFWKREQPLTMDDALKKPKEVPIEQIEDVLKEEEAE